MKADYDEFRQFLTGLPKQLSLDRIRSHWTKYAFHFTDVRNAAKILSDDQILSRASLQSGSFIDVASPIVISHTDREVSDYVRLYFRPRTPTQFRSEGIRPFDKLWEGSHCPVPVFFLFDLVNLLIRDDCLFSDGNLAKLGYDSLCSTAADLGSFAFDKIYHVTWVSNEEREDIVSHRNAEIVIPGSLDLSALKWIYCRSAAERETLLYLLPPKISDRWSSRIAIETTATLFYRKWVFVETVQLNEKGIEINFSPDPEHPGPFELTVIRKTNGKREHRKLDFYAYKRTTIEFETNIWNYSVEVYLNDCLTFAGSYDGSADIPF
jgi:hypothetical protein